MISSPLRLLASLVSACVLVFAVAACGGDDKAASDKPTIVVTTSPLAALVQELVGDTANVDVLIPNNLDPHDFQPSVKDAERLADAKLIVSNGAELEVSLEDAIEQAEKDGVPVFVAAEHVPLAKGGDIHEDEHGDEHADGHADEHAGEKAPADEHAGEKAPADEHAEEEHHHGAFDPHIWLDPVLMQKAMKELAPVVAREVGVDLGDRPTKLNDSLEALNAELTKKANTLAPDKRNLVTGHDSMGYFARRYDFTVIGTVIPSLSSQAEVSASQVAKVTETLRDAKTGVIFVEVGTPAAVTDAIASDSGARSIFLNTHAVAADGSYETTMRELMTTIVDGLGSGK